MNRYDRLMTRVGKGEKILLDGATGTECERRGVPQLDNAWNGGGALSDPDIVHQVHMDYIRKGAQIVISNTFATSRHALEAAGIGDEFEHANRSAVELAVEARDNCGRPDVLVAGGISYWSWVEEQPSLEAIARDVEEQAGIMADAGADLIMLEMMVHIDRMLVALEAAQKAGLPVWVGLSCAPDDTGTMCLLGDGTLADALLALKDRDVPVLSIMHTQVEHVDGCLDVVFDHWKGPVCVYAHSSTSVDGKWGFDAVISPPDYAAAAKRWLERGVSIIGGCCGLNVAHIAALGRLLDAAE